jgi:hypothetical protein
MQDRHPYAIYDVQPCALTPGGFFLEFVAFERYNLTLAEAQQWLTEVRWTKTHGANVLRNQRQKNANFQLFQLTPVSELVESHTLAEAVN